MPLPAGVLLCLAMSFPHQIPPNQPGKLTFQDGRLKLEYMGESLMEGRMVAPGGIRSLRTPVMVGGQGQIDQVFAVTVDGEATLTAVVSDFDLIPCQADRPDDDSPLIVRHTSGKVVNLLDRGLYCRNKDFLLSVDPHSFVSLERRSTGGFALTVKGSEIILRFRPRYYSVHRGLKTFEPWLHELTHEPVVGWCSWFAYFQDVTEEKIKKTADVLSKQLVPYGLHVLQMDDGYQRDPVGFSETWLTPNSKFPGGLASLASYIADRGLTPGIWSYTSFHKKDDVAANPKLFVRGTDGKPAYGRWVGYSPDGSNPEALKKIIDPLYQGYIDQGWKYFKVDSLRHLRYEGYNSHAAYFGEKDRVTAYRNVVEAIRKKIGSSFLLACWGARPELAGLIDGCRIGGDGFSYVGLAQFNSFNNIVWQNDPDHIQLTPKEAYRSCLLTSLSGSLFMLTDKPEVYQTEETEAARRCIPVLKTKPGQVYDVDPSRTSLFDRVDSEVSGDGPRPFDAGGRPQCELYQLDLGRPWENWTIVGRIPVEPERDRGATVRFVDLGLDPNQTYHVYEFWSQRYLGSFKTAFETGQVLPKFGCQCFCIRKALGRPQLLATGRHVSCGGVDVQDVRWENNALEITVQVMNAEPSVIKILEPAGSPRTSINGGTVMSNERVGDLRTVTIKSNGSAQASIRLDYGSGER